MSFEGIQLIYSAEVCREAIPLARSIECEGPSTYVSQDVSQDSPRREDTDEVC